MARASNVWRPVAMNTCPSRSRSAKNTAAAMETPALSAANCFYHCCQLKLVPLQHWYSVGSRRLVERAPRSPTDRNRPRDTWCGKRHSHTGCHARRAVAPKLTREISAHRKAKEAGRSAHAIGVDTLRKHVCVGSSQQRESCEWKFDWSGFQMWPGFH